MSIFVNLMESMKLQKLNGISSDRVVDSFLANYCAALLFLRLGDLQGLRLINDKSHQRLPHFTSTMSEINFWGRALFYPEDAEVKKRLLPNHWKVLHDQAGRILDSRVRAIVALVNEDPSKLNWNEPVAYLILLRHRFEVQSSYLNKIGYSLQHWDRLNANERKQAINSAFMYLLQSDPKSSLLPRLRALNTSTMLKVADTTSKIIIGFKKLNEDGDGGAAPAGTDAGNIATTNAIVNGGCDQALGGLYRLEKPSPHQVTKKRGKIAGFVKDGRVIKKRVKRWKPIKFKAPAHVKPQGEE